MCVCEDVCVFVCPYLIWQLADVQETLSNCLCVCVKDDETLAVCGLVWGHSVEGVRSH